MLAVPAVPIVEDHVYSGRILRQILHAKQLHDGRALTAPVSRIELPNAQQLGRLASPRRLANGAPDHRWKVVEVWHRIPMVRK